ncbi:O-antigen ligase family protein [Brumicola blandensis]|uniref:O-antigen ligase family protein n=1 Tax=Brumicola blandensis TaxID=3075611 RepID=A0AAW8QZN6_9ALTE|nr:O-antigen ligase family protein [Alteromonas sp. W409]MDT0582633.1 O-antigen ligase family protein [Alteromonas sp. W409]
MLKILVYLLLAYGVVGVFVNPWVPIVFYYLNGIMQPQFIWPWTFPEFPISLSKILAIMSILALFKSIFFRQVSFGVFKAKQNLALLAIWILFHLSDSLSPFPIYFAGVTSDIVLSALDTIVILYFVGLGLLSNVQNYEKSFKYMCVMFAFITVYYVYWANDMYFSQRWDMFTNGRLNSPRGTSIGDQNALSVLVVMGMPFFLIGYFYLNSKIQKLFCLGVIPVLWHSLFLFGSRGALIALTVTTLITMRMLTKHQKASINLEKLKQVGLFKKFIVVGLVVGVLTQGGILLSRTSETAERAQSQGEEPINPRLVSWMVGKKLILNYPLLGAGPQRFQMASQAQYPGESVHVAHNTFINFSANTGLPVGFLFLAMFWFNYKNFKFCKQNQIERYPILDFVDKSCAAALVAYFVGALFLDLIIFEAFYFILMLNLAKLHVFSKLIEQPTKQVESIEPVRANKMQNRVY